MKILAAVDGSPHSSAMLDKLCDHLAWFRAPPEIVLFHVHLALPYQRAVAWAGKDAVAQYYEEEGNAALAPARALLDRRGVAYTIEKRVGDPAAEIVQTAASGAFDLIAMGTRGHAALASLVMGSVATKVVATSAVAVLLLK